MLMCQVQCSLCIVIAVSWTCNKIPLEGLTVDSLHRVECYLCPKQATCGCRSHLLRSGDPRVPSTLRNRRACPRDARSLTHITVSQKSPRLVQIPAEKHIHLPCSSKYSLSILGTRAPGDRMVGRNSVIGGVSLRLVSAC